MVWRFLFCREFLMQRKGKIMNSDESAKNQKNISKENLDDLIRQIGDEAMRRTIEWAKNKGRSSINSTHQPTEPENEAENDTADSTRGL
jgi:hypothetical protein